MRSTDGPAPGRYLQMPVDARGFRTPRASRVQNPPPRCWPKMEDRAAASAATPDGDPSLPPNAGPRADCRTTTPSPRAGRTASAQPTPPPVVGKRAPSQALLGARIAGTAAPAPPADPNEWLTQSRPARRHRGNGEPIRYRGARHRDKSSRQRWSSTEAALRGAGSRTHQTPVVRPLRQLDQRRSGRSLVTHGSSELASSATARAPRLARPREEAAIPARLEATGEPC
jgi:hypothetical protein